MIKIFFIVVSMLIAAGCGSHVSNSPNWMTMGTVAKISFKNDSIASKFSDFCNTSPDGRKLVETVKSVYSEVESRLSIWDKDSEISNFSSVENVSPDMRPCYLAAFKLQEISGNIFNPFWRGAAKGPDLGGIAKGFAVDLAAERISRSVASNYAGRGVLLDLGGNLKVVSGTWRTGIRNPFGDMLYITLTNSMACATSGEYERGKHIYDGRTGKAVSNNLVSVTVVHPCSAMIADGLSTTLFVLGKEDGENFLKVHYPEAKAYWILRDRQK